MCLHYLVKVIARVLSPYITNTPCFVTKSYVPQLQLIANNMSGCFFSETRCKLSAVGVSELVWKQVPDSGSGDWECPTVECATSMAWYGQWKPSQYFRCVLFMYIIELPGQVVLARWWSDEAPHRAPETLPLIQFRSSAGPKLTH